MVCVKGGKCLGVKFVKLIMISGICVWLINLICVFGVFVFGMWKCEK